MSNEMQRCAVCGGQVFVVGREILKHTRGSKVAEICPASTKKKRILTGEEKKA